MRFGYLLLAATALAQTPVPTLASRSSPQFDSDLVTPAEPQTGSQVRVQGSIDTVQGMLKYTNITVKDFMSQALDLRPDQIRGPDWLDMNRYDFSATFPPHTSAPNVSLMVQELLMDRFRMTTHTETEQRPIYNLVASEGVPHFTLKPGADAATGTHGHVTIKGSMRHFAGFLSHEADRPVIDETGLTGSYEFSLDWDDSAIAQALGPQLGLKLVPTTGPVEIMVFDRAEPLHVDTLADKVAFAIQIGVISREDWPGNLCVADGYQRYARDIGLTVVQRQLLFTPRGKAALDVLSPAQRATLDSLPAELRQEREKHPYPASFEGPLCH